MTKKSFLNRKRAGILAAAVLLASTLTASPLFAQSNSDQSGMPKVGDMAPDFTLKYFDGTDRKDVKLSDYRGKKNVVLAFFVFAFTGG
jgi:cytochrome oxidase Cu insertion factor (SCO1/SenC/PrrC family)